MATAALCAFFIGVREYEQMFGWKAGMDSYSGEFQTYWMPVLYIFTTLELIAFLGLVFYLFRTRDLDVAKVGDASRDDARPDRGLRQGAPESSAECQGLAGSC